MTTTLDKRAQYRAEPPRGAHSALDTALAGIDVALRNLEHEAINPAGASDAPPVPSINPHSGENANTGNQVPVRPSSPSSSPPSLESDQKFDAILRKLTKLPPPLTRQGSTALPSSTRHTNRDIGVDASPRQITTAHAVTPPAPTRASDIDGAIRKLTDVIARHDLQSSASSALPAAQASQAAGKDNRPLTNQPARPTPRSRPDLDPEISDAARKLKDLIAQPGEQGNTSQLSTIEPKQSLVGTANSPKTQKAIQPGPGTQQVSRSVNGPPVREHPAASALPAAQITPAQPPTVSLQKQGNLAAHQSVEHAERSASPAQPNVTSKADNVSQSAKQDKVSSAAGHPSHDAKIDARLKAPDEARPVISPRPQSVPEMGPVLDAEKGKVSEQQRPVGNDQKNPSTGGGGRKSGFHQRSEAPNFAQSFQNGLNAVRHNLLIVMAFTVVTNILVLAIPIYLFQISDRVLTSRSLDTLIMLTIVIAGAIVLQAVLDALRRFILTRTAVEVAAQLGGPILSAAARASLNGNGKDYHVLGDLQQLRSFITSGTLLSILDAPLSPLFVVVVFLIHPDLGFIIVVASVVLLALALVNQRMTARHFSDSSAFLSRATLHLDSMARNAQIINAMAMIPEAVRIWGRDTANSLRAQAKGQDRNVVIASISRGFRMLTQVGMLGWGAYLAIQGELTGGMVIAASIIASRALGPIEGAIEGWHQFTSFRAAFQRIRNLLQTSPLNVERLRMPDPKGRLDVERVLYVPPPTKKVILNGVSFSLMPGESLAIVGNSGSGKTTLGKMLVGSILPTSGSVRLDLMDLRNWDPRQFGENIGYLPQDVQLFPGTIKANIARMHDDAKDRDIYEAAMLADVHELIASFSQGYETIVAGDGAPLSGGQKQRIALARAFFGNPRLVVLDEPNSNLDTAGENALARALMHAKRQGITTITITQRTSLLNCVDKIMVLNAGTVAMLGERTDVLRVLTTPSSGTAASPETSSRAMP